MIVGVLNQQGGVKVVAEVTFTPTGGSPNSESQSVKLKKKR